MNLGTEVGWDVRHYSDGRFHGIWWKQVSKQRGIDCFQSHRNALLIACIVCESSLLTKFLSKLLFDFTRALL